VGSPRRRIGFRRIREKEKEARMDRPELEEKVRKVLAENLGRDLEEVTLEARLEEDLDADSLDLVEAVLALEEELGVKIPEEEMESVKTVREAVDLVSEKIEGGG
jgi:acyl carrier protein